MFASNFSSTENALGVTSGGTLFIESVAKSQFTSYEDRVNIPVKVMPRGFAATFTHGAVLSPHQISNFTFSLPDDVVPGSLITSTKLYTSPAGNLMEAVAKLIQEPYGCFEQTSATTYPLVSFL